MRKASIRHNIGNDTLENIIIFVYHQIMHSEAYLTSS